MFSDQVPLDKQSRPVLKAWSWITIVTLIVVLLGYLCAIIVLIAGSLAISVVAASLQKAVQCYEPLLTPRAEVRFKPR